MMSPEDFYDMRLKGKPEKEIKRLKNIVEHPAYALREWIVDPGDYQ